MYKERLKAKHPYENRNTEYYFAGVQRFEGEEYPLYTADEGTGTTVSLNTIMEREQEDLLLLLGLVDVMKK